MRYFDGIDNRSPNSLQNKRIQTLKPKPLRPETHCHKMRDRLGVIGLWRLILVFQCCCSLWQTEAAECVRGCETALAFYTSQANETLDTIGAKFQTPAESIRAVNPGIDAHHLDAGQALRIPFSCDCVQGELLHLFNYQVQRTDTIDIIVSTVYEGLTRAKWIGSWSALNDLNFIMTGSTLTIPVKCSCGNPEVGLDYGLFLTYVVPAGAGGTLSGLATKFNTSEVLLKAYNPNIFWDDAHPEQYAFIPAKDESGKYPPYSLGSSNTRKITWTVVALGVATGVGGALAFLSLLSLCLRCSDVEHQRRQQMRHVATKLKDADDPAFA